MNASASLMAMTYPKFKNVAGQNLSVQKYGEMGHFSDTSSKRRRESAAVFCLFVFFLLTNWEKPEWGMVLNNPPNLGEC